MEVFSTIIGVITSVAIGSGFVLYNKFSKLLEENTKTIIETRLINEASSKIIKDFLKRGF